MGIFKVIRNTNDELDYLYNVLNYTMGIHTDYDKRYSPNVDIYHAYEQFLSVKKYFGKTSGNPAFHFIVVYDARSKLLTMLPCRVLVRLRSGNPDFDSA